MKIMKAAVGLVPIMLIACHQGLRGDAPSKSNNHVSQPRNESRLRTPASTHRSVIAAGSDVSAKETESKSAEAAERLVEKMADLLNSRRFDDAYGLLTATSRPRNQFIQAFAEFQNLRVSVEPPRRPEGAAGSIFIAVPVTISGTRQGKIERAGALVFVRRVNDVPGSTVAQRRWHIEDIVWQRHEGLDFN